MAVGSALIALGALPLQLRAKGYGAKVAISRVEKMMRCSLRRVTFHALSELKTSDPCEFGTGSSALSEDVLRMLKEVAALLASSKHSALRLCVEGHADTLGTPSENAALSLERAEAVSKHLESLGVDTSRLSPHGFGSAFPIDDNATDAGRQRNRRVEFLVIPSCFASASMLIKGRTDAATTLASHLSNRPGVSRFVS